MEHRDGGVVAERDVVEADLAPDLGQLLSVGRLLYRRLGLEEVAQLEDGRPALLERVVLLGQQLNRCEEPVHVQEERGELTEVELVVQEHVPAEAEDEHLPEHAERL